MSEREKNVIRKLSELMPKLDKENQNYVIGIVEGMVLAKASQQGRQFQEA